MFEVIFKFLQFITARDLSKWYSFSIFDMFMLIVTGLSYFVIDTKNSPALFWIIIIGMNAVETFYHNKTTEK